MVDRSSRWLEAVPLSSTDTATIAAAFTSSWIARFGVPDHLTSDQGPQFCSALWSELSQWWGIKHHLTTAYHPQANGMVESTPPAQGRFASPRRRRQLDFSSPLGSTWHAGGSQRGLQLIFSRVSVRRPSSDSWSAPRCTGTAAGGFSRGSQSGPLTHPRKESIIPSASRVHPSGSG